MLGRLLAKNMLYESSNTADETSVPYVPHVSDETKQKLYGTKHLEMQASSAHRFRVVVAQELGQMMSRHNYQVVLDYATSRGSGMNHISVSDLKEYIFGSPVRAKTRHKCDKFRVVAGAGVVLVTRVFYPSQRDTRLAICLSLPESFLSALSEIWTHIGRWLDECQALLLAILSNDSLVSLPRDLRAHDPQITESIIQSIHTLIVPLVSSHTDIPRLLLYPSSSRQFVLSWFKDVFHWLDIKDGHRLRFLPVLFAKIAQDFAAELRANECSRIIIISGNMVVANKLIFLISALLGPRYSGRIDISDDTPQLGHSERQKPLKDERQSLDNKYFSTITGKGWEIPNKKTPNSSTSLSSDETSAQVIQPSSIRSSSSSLQYLSSSLSSVYGSYGSWFSKRIGMQSPSAKTNESSEQSYFQHHNGSSTSLHQVALNHNRVTPLPSPSINEYEEFPWCSSPSSPRTDNTQQAWPAHTEPSFQNVDIKRTCNRITNAKDLDQAFESICQFDSDSFKAETSAPSEGHAQVLEVELEIDSHSSYSELLPKYTSFLPNFVPWFQLQAVPVTSDAERKVLNAMKADLHTREYSRTLLISLRSREIKDIVVEKDHFLTKNVLRTKRVFSSGKCSSMSPKFQQQVLQCEQNIKKAMSVWEDVENVADKMEILQKIFEDIRS
ncbi:Protein LST4 [Lachancea thermotolerans]